MKLLSLNDIYNVAGGTSDRESFKDKVDDLIDDFAEQTEKGADKMNEGADKVNRKIHEIMQ